MLRVAGALIPIAKYPTLTNEETETMLKSIVPPERWDSFRQNQTIDLSYAHKVNARFRVNGYRAQERPRLRSGSCRATSTRSPS